MDQKILESEGAVIKKYNKGEIIFLEGNEPRCFFHILSGEVKMFNINSDGKEFTQGVFGNGVCFGEAPLIINENYPASAIATKETNILKLAGEKFHRLVDCNSDFVKELLIGIARKTYNKSITLREVINNPPEVRILSFLDAIKSKQEVLPAPGTRWLVPFTRQEIANYTGLRVETVIRTLLRMKKNEQVEIIDRKLYY